MRSTATIELPDPNAPLDSEWRGSVHALFSAVAARADTKLAVQSDDGERWSYHDLDLHSSHLARRLRALGCERGDRVAILAHRSAYLASAVLAVLKAQAAFVILDAGYPNERLQTIVRAARPKVLLLLPLTSGSRSSLRLEGLAIVVDVPPLRETGEAMAAAPDDEHSTVNADDVAYLAFTSGSTGTPKGVIGRHGPLTYFQPWRVEEFALSPDDRFSMLSGLAHDPLHRDLFTPLLLGASLHVPSQDVIRQGRISEWIARERITVTHLTPAFVELLDENRHLPSLRRIFFVGDALRRADISKIRRIAPHAHVISYYGATETQQALAFHVVPLPGDAATTNTSSEEIIPLGRGAPGVQLLIVGAPPERRNVLEVGQTGEIAIRSPHLARGYWDDEKATQCKFANGDLYFTGDFGRYLPNGEVEFVGRSDDQIKIRGFRVELEEIRVALTSQSAHVRSAIVLARKDDAGEPSIVAFVTPREPIDGAEDDEQHRSRLPHSLHAALAAKLPDFMVPRTSAIHVIDSFPLTPNGKIDRAALLALAATTFAERALVVAAPESETEIALARIWREVLHVPEVGRSDDFFDLGGHSLRATQILARMRAALGVDVDATALFQTRTLAAFAAYVDDLRSSRPNERLAPLVDELRSSRPAGRLAPLDDQHRTRATSSQSEIPWLTIRRRPDPTTAKAPASFAQERMYFLARMNPDAATLNVPLILRLQGELDADALDRALNAIVRRHEVLRTTFVEDGDNGQLYQHVHDGDDDDDEGAGRPLVLNRVDGGDVEAAIRAEIHRPFDLTSRSMLVRATLIDGHVLVLVMHHAIYDGWSHSILENELLRLYSSFKNKKPATKATLDALPIQYGDYAVWQRENHNQSRLTEPLAYWKRALAGAPPSLDLPTDRARPAIKSMSSGSVPILLGKALVEDVEALARRAGATPFMVILAAFYSVLARWSNQRDIVIGTLVAGRQQVEIEPLIGLFINTLALRIAAPPTSSQPESFLDCVLRVKETCLGAYAHQEVPFEQVIEAIAPSRDPSRTPMFQAMLVLHNAPESEASEASGLSIATESPDLGGWGFDVYAILTPDSKTGELHGVIEYDASIFNASTMERLSTHFIRMLEEGTRRPHDAASRLPIMAPSERHCVLSTWNDTRRDLNESCVHAQFEARAALCPAAVAIEIGDERMTYGELNQRANRLAHHLVSHHGVKPEQVVAVCMDRCLELLVALYAIMKAGAAYAPLDPTYPALRLELLLNDLDAPIVLTTSACTNLPASTAEGTPVLYVDREIPPNASEHDHHAPVKPDERRSAYVIYTSGSTGMPKGVVNVHSGLRNRLAWMQHAYPIDEDDVVLQKTPYTFDVSVWELFWPLMHGARIVFAKPDGHRDPDYLIDLIRSKHITTCHFVPSMLGVFLEHPEVSHCSSLARVICSGEALPRTLQDRFFEKLPHCELHNLYGPTEASIDVSYWACDRNDPHNEVPIGKPIWNTELYIIDREYEPSPIGVPGELCISGVGLARSYFKRPLLTGDRFIPNPFSASPGARMYRTGDLARWLPDGTIEYLGRLDNQVKLRGLRIELGEIEAVLGSLPSVRAATAVVREDAKGDKRLVAYVVTNGDGDALGHDQLRKALRAKLPDYMVPAAFVVLDAFPLTSSGKVDRKALPAPDFAAEAGGGSNATYVAPRDDLETFLAETFALTLGVPRVGVYDDFFVLGGHSLLLMKALNVIRARSETAKALTIRDLFEAPNVDALTQRLRAARAAAASVELPTITRTDLPDGRGISFAQHFILTWESNHRPTKTWNAAGHARIDGELDFDRLRLAIRKTLARQESLRHVFDPRVPGFDQRICSVDDVMCELLEGFGENDDAAVARFIDEQSNAVVSVDDHAPLLRFFVLRRNAQRHDFVAVWHQLVHDPTSFPLLTEDIFTHYEDRGAALPLPPLPIRHTDYVKWERDWYEKEEGGGQAEVAAVKKRLENAKPLNLPTDFSRDVRLDPEKRGAPFMIEGDDARRFQSICRAEGVSPYIAISAISAVLLHRWSRSRTDDDDDVVFVTPVDLRKQRSEVAHLTGRFYNLILIRLSLKDAATLTWRELFARTRREVMDALQFDRAPISLVLGTDHPYDHPLCRALLNFIDVEQPMPPRSFGGHLTLSNEEGVTGQSGARNEFILAVRNAPNRVFGAVAGSKNRFKDETLQRYAAAFAEAIRELDPSANVKVAGGRRR